MVVSAQSQALGRLQNLSQIPIWKMALQDTHSFPFWPGNLGWMFTFSHVVFQPWGPGPTLSVFPSWPGILSPSLGLVPRASVAQKNPRS